ncbi:MAG TPA: beta-ketoacyl-ACP synthase II [Anaerolineales bacterium]|nr:beta-ketoacyl-ACP synthase II [Anaerolineales bacterium]
MVEAQPRSVRIVITGLGLLTPLGIGVDDFWEGLRTGRSGVRRVKGFDVSDIPSQIAGDVQGFEPRQYVSAKDVRRITRATQFAVAAAQHALQDAGLEVTDDRRDQIGVLIANGGNSPVETERLVLDLHQGGYDRMNPFHIAGSLPNMPSSHVAIHFGLNGFISTISTACAASSQAIGEAAHVIRRGDARWMLAGGTEAPIGRYCLAGFSALRALSTRNDDPGGASRPFDAGRDGFVLSEGVGVVLLERLEDAEARGARIYAELVGYGSSSDAHHITAPDPAGRGAARAMQRALSSAGMGIDSIDYINAHATSTAVGDSAETLAIKTVFGERAYQIPVSSTKSMTGHMTSAAGAVEAAACILALTHGVLPPTINYEQPDPVCDLDYVPNQARQADVRVAMSNSFGFGGVNSVLILQRMGADGRTRGAGSG